VVRFEPDRQDADMGLRVDLIRAARQNRPLAIPGATMDKGAVIRAMRVSEHLRRRLGIKMENDDTDDLGRLLAWAYPDRIARLRPGLKGKFLLSSGRGAFLDETSPLGGEPFLVAVELDGKGREARIYKAAPYPFDTLMNQFQDRLKWSESIRWYTERCRVKSERHLKLGAITVRNERLSAPDSEKVLKVFLEGIKQKGIGCLPWNRRLRRWQECVCFLRRLLKDNETSFEELWSVPLGYVPFATFGIGPDGSVYSYSSLGEVIRINPETGTVINTSDVILTGTSSSPRMAIF